MLLFSVRSGTLAVALARTRAGRPGRVDLRGLRPVLHRVLCLIRADAIIGRGRAAVVGCKAVAVAPAKAAAAGLLSARSLLLLLLLALLLLLLSGMVLPAEAKRATTCQGQTCVAGSLCIKSAPPADLFSSLTHRTTACTTVSSLMKGRRPSRFLFCQQVSNCIAQFSAVPIPMSAAGAAGWCLCCCWPLLAALQRLSSGRGRRLTLWLPWRLCRAGWRLVKAPLWAWTDIWDTLSSHTSVCSSILPSQKASIQSRSNDVRINWCPGPFR